MDLSVGSRDHRENEFYSFRYATRLQKGEIVEIRTGLDLEVARFQARKSFPDVINEYWWLKPSDIPAFRELPLKISDIYYYHGGVPVVVVLTAQGSIARKAQVFLKRKDEHKNAIEEELRNYIYNLDQLALCEFLLDQNLLVRLYALKLIQERNPNFIPNNEEQLISFHILTGNFDALIPFEEAAVDPLIERFFVTSHPRETERIIDTLIAIGTPALGRLDDIAEFLSVMASPYYAKRINWTVSQIKKSESKNGILG
jgi:hypothetical protein